MSEKTVLHVAPAGLQGGWRVEIVGSGESENLRTREEAEARAQELAAAAEGEATVLVHDEEGRISDEWSEDDAPPTS